MKKFQTLTVTRRRAVEIAVVAIAVLGVVPWKLAAQEATKPRSKKTATTSAPITKEDLLRTRSIVVHVVDLDGNPIEGAKVSRTDDFDRIGSGPMADYLMSRSPKLVRRRHRTDANGKAVVEISEVLPNVALSARKDGFVPMGASWSKKSQADALQVPKEFTFKLERGSKIGGVVKNERGRPIKGVKVMVRDTSRGGHRYGEPRKRPTRLHSYGAVYTDAKGRWSLDNVPTEESLVPKKEALPKGVQAYVAVHNNPPEGKFLLWLSHPDYFNDTEWGSLQLQQFVTHETLRDQTATIRMNADKNAQRDEED